MFCTKLKLIMLFWAISSSIVNAQLLEFDLINHFKLSKNVLVARTDDTYPDQVVAISTNKEIVLNDADISPILSDKYFFFTSNKSGNRDIYWTDAKITEDIKPDYLK